MAKPSLSGKSDAAVEKNFHNQQQQKAQEQEIYEATYKNILWIDDRSDKDAGSDPLSWMEYWLIKNDDMQHIEQVNLFQDAVEKIICYEKYDLVIFDINLEDSFMESTDDKAYLESEFQKCNIKFQYDDVSSPEGKKTAGIYLYLLLLSKGYPINRMLIYTGNGADAFEDHIEKKLGYFDFNSYIYKRKSQNILNIEDYFSGKKNYYRIRRLVLHACDCWEKQLQTVTDSKAIPFNQIYFSGGNHKSKESFLEILNHIRLLFPVAEPSNPQKIYYQAMKIASTFHEESAKIEKVRKFPHLLKYHSCVRNYRNWTAHHKLGENPKQELNGEYFVLLFCIAMRTYFDGNAQNFSFSTNLLEYEKQYFHPSGNEHAIPQNANELSTCLTKVLHCTLNKMKDDGYLISKNMNQIVRKYGKQKNAKLSHGYLFLPLWSDSISIKTELLPPAKNSKNEMQLIFRIPEDTCQKIIKASAKNDAESVFMNFCYRWINSINSNPDGKKK